MNDPTLPRKRRRRAWPSAADAVRMEAISVLMDISTSAENARILVCQADGAGVLSELLAIQTKARKGQVMLNRAKDL